MDYCKTNSDIVFVPTGFLSVSLILLHSEMQLVWFTIYKDKRSDEDHRLYLTIKYFHIGSEWPAESLGMWAQD